MLLSAHAHTAGTVGTRLIGTVAQTGNGCGARRLCYSVDFTFIHVTVTVVVRNQMRNLLILLTAVVAFATTPAKTTVGAAGALK